MFEKFFSKMRGNAKSPPIINFYEIVWSWIGALIGIGALGYIHSRWCQGDQLVMIIGSFGASAVLIYGAIKSPLAQPRNLLGGHIISAIIGVSCYKIFPDAIWVSSALSVATAIALMHATKTLHPPGGATALIAVIGGKEIHSLGYLYVIIPVGIGAVIMLIIALIVNNIPQNRRYPEYWW